MKIVPIKSAQTGDSKIVPIEMAQIPNVLFSTGWSNHQLLIPILIPPTI